MQAFVDVALMWRALLAIVVVGALLLQAHSDAKQLKAGPAVTLAENGEGRVTIVLPAAASTSVQQAAAELSHYVSAMAGALPLPIKVLPAPPPASPSASYLFVGYVGWALREAAFDPTVLAPEGYAIFAHNSSWLFVVGRNDTDSACTPHQLGAPVGQQVSHNDTLLGAYGLLDQLGVRWLWPGESQPLAVLSLQTGDCEAIQRDLPTRCVARMTLPPVATCR